MRPLRLGPARVPDDAIEAFREVAPSLESFARDKDLFIERYRRGKAAWELRFARKLGGEAAITVSYRERTGHVFDISALWWLDDVSQRTRRLRSQKVGVHDRRGSASDLAALLTRALAAIDGWGLADLSPPYGPFREMTGAGTGMAGESTLPRR